MLEHKEVITHIIDISKKDLWDLLKLSGNKVPDKLPEGAWISLDRTEKICLSWVERVEG